MNPTNRPLHVPPLTREELDQLVCVAEASLGWPVHDVTDFQAHCQQHGLGDAMNREHDLLP